MAEQLTFEIATPERLILSESVDEVVLPSVNGYMGVLAGHAPLLARLEIGELSYRSGNTKRFLSVSGGFAEVLREGVRVLAETCEPAEEIDIERARRAKEKAEAELKRDLPTQDFRKWEVHLKRAISRMNVRSRVG